MEFDLDDDAVRIGRRVADRHDLRGFTEFLEEDRFHGDGSVFVGWNEGRQADRHARKALAMTRFEISCRCR